MEIDKDISRWRKDYRHRKGLAQKRRENNREIANKAKVTGCIVCGEKDIIVLEFHHRPGEIKVNNISTLIWRASTKTLLSEIEKCDVICANCHTRQHRKAWWKESSDKIGIALEVVKNGCQDCKVNEIEVLVFHHIDSDIKLHHITTLLSAGASILTLQEELHKCIVLCANCHVRRHRNRRV